SVGVARFPDDGRDARTLVQRAGAAACGAKEIGRDVYQVYSGAAGAHGDAPSLARDLRLAIDRDELELHFQPQVELSSGTICGAEAFVRWRHPQLGLLAAADFLHAAEETGLIIRIGAWVLRTACGYMRAWSEAGI